MAGRAGECAIATLEWHPTVAHGARERYVGQECLVRLKPDTTLDRSGESRTLR
jgi:hypothetical protein